MGECRTIICAGSEKRLDKIVSAGVARNIRTAQQYNVNTVSNSSNLRKLRSTATKTTAARDVEYWAETGPIVVACPK